jgi:hypothetical protein
MTAAGTIPGHGKRRLMRLQAIVLISAALGVTFVRFQMQQEQDLPTWVQFPAGHWLQEPDGFNGMKFDATRSETEKVVKVEDCVTAIYGNLSCKVTLQVAGKPFAGEVLFGVPHDPKTGAVTGEGRLANITAAFKKPEFDFVKAAFIKMYGHPHQATSSPQVESGEFLSWIGNKAMIRLTLLRDDASFVISPNPFARGGKIITTIEELPTTQKR